MHQKPKVNHITQGELRKLYFGLVFWLILCNQLSAQKYSQSIRGTVFDAENSRPLSGVTVLCMTGHPVVGCVTDSLGGFHLEIPDGSHSFSFSRVGYYTRQLKNIQISLGKEVLTDVSLTSQVYQIDEVNVRTNRNEKINPMATVSAHSVNKTEFNRFVAGSFDASRIVGNFAGVISGTGDDKNEIIVRGNSPRGLLWHLEGIEIPNPNHFSLGKGNTGGRYSVLNTSVFSSFDFFIGSFPAEYGNAYSGVMDLNLRSGNPEQHEFSVDVSTLGLEGSAEGPVGKKKGLSYLINYRYSDYSYLTKLGFLEPDGYPIIPKSSDFVFKTTYQSERSGTFDLFALGGSSKIGFLQMSEIHIPGSESKLEEIYLWQRMAVAGMKHAIQTADGKTEIKSTAAVTYDYSSMELHPTGTTSEQNFTYQDHFSYPVFRLSTQINYRYNDRHSARLGATYNHIWGQMFAEQLNPEMQYDTLLNKTGKGWYADYYGQWKYQSRKWFESVTGLHAFHSGVTHEFILEPRLGAIVRLPGQQSLNFGLGLHSRLEPLAVYNYQVRISKTLREEKNIDLKTTKALHLTGSYVLNLGDYMQFTVEAYLQYLRDVPVSTDVNNPFSLINSTDGLPSGALNNNGKARNKGLEFTLRKLLSHHYYFLANASLFSSKYRASDGIWYNTYFNTTYICNLLAGASFQIGKQKQHTLEFKLRGNQRGGFRYTPVDQAASILHQTVVYETENNLASQLPAYKRIDFGVGFRMKKRTSAFSWMVDLQNIMNAKNVVYRSFGFQNNSVKVYDTKSLGLLPMITIKAEF